MNEDTKAKAAKIWEDVKTGLKTGFAVTKKGLSKTGSAIQNYSDLAVVQIEKKQFEAKLKKAYASLGELAVSKLTAKNAAALTAKDEDVSELLKDVATFKKEISKREKVLKSATKESGSKPAEKKAAAKKAAKSAK